MIDNLCLSMFTLFYLCLPMFAQVYLRLLLLPMPTVFNYVYS